MWQQIARQFASGLLTSQAAAVMEAFGLDWATCSEVLREIADGDDPS